jgi:hypothetical protein
MVTQRPRVAPTSPLNWSPILGRQAFGLRSRCLTDDVNGYQKLREQLPTGDDTDLSIRTMIIVLLLSCQFVDGPSVKVVDDLVEVISCHPKVI